MIRVILALSIVVFSWLPVKANTIFEYHDLTGVCRWDCESIGLSFNSPVSWSISFNTDAYSPYGPLTTADLADFSFLAGDFSFSLADAAAVRIEGPASYWQGPGETPAFYLFASEFVGQPGRYVNIASFGASAAAQDWGGYLGIAGTCLDADCFEPRSGPNIVISAIPVPASISFSLIGAACLAGAALRARRRIGA